MSNEFPLYVRKQFQIEAVRVNSENMKRVAEWCEGDLTPIPNLIDRGPVCINIHSHQHGKYKDTMAFSGDWVTFNGENFKVYPHKQFEAVFDPKPSEETLKKLVLEKLKLLVMDGQVAPLTTPMLENVASGIVSIFSQGGSEDGGTTS